MDGESEDNSPVCRLCSSKQNLIDLFNAEGEQCVFYQNIFECATGIVIKEDDVVSKMVCQSCCEIAIKLHKYRTNAIANDRLLKEKCAAKNNLVQADSNSISTKHILHLFNLTLSKDLAHQTEPFTGFPASTVKVAKRNLSNIPKEPSCHPTVKIVQKNNPNLVIPDHVVTQDVLPVVTLDRAEVTSWYEEQIFKVRKKLGNITIKKLNVNVETSNKDIAKSSKVAAKRCPANRDKNKIVREVRKSSKTPVSPKSDDSSKVSSSVNKVEVKKKYKQASTANTKDGKASLNKATNINDANSLLRELMLKTTSTGKAKTPNAATRSPTDHNGTQKSKSKEKVNSITTPVEKPVAPKIVARKRTSARKSQSHKEDAVPNKIPRISKDTVSTSNSAPETSSTAIISKNASIQNKVNDVNVTSTSNSKGDDREDSLFMNTSKSLKVFICSICSLVCETRKALTNHQRSHLSCQACKRKFKNLESLEEHEKEHYARNNLKEAVIKLTRIDSIQSVINTYPQAFQSDESDAEYDNGHFDNTETDYFDSEIKYEDDFNIDIEDHNVENIVPEEEVKREANVVFVSDESDNDVEICVPTDSDITNKSLFFISQLHSSENNMIHNLYKKHFGTKTFTNGTQTFRPSTTTIKCNLNNIVILENMYTELMSYRIPVQLECQPEMCARFTTVETAKKLEPLEYWGHKKPIDLQRIPLVRPLENGVPFEIVDVTTDTNISSGVSNITEDSSDSASVNNEPVSVVSNPSAISLTNLLSTSTNPVNDVHNGSKTVPDSSILSGILSSPITVSTPQIVSVTTQSAEVVPDNNIIINSSPSSTHANLLLDNTVPEVNNIVDVSNETQPPVVNNIVSNASISVPLNVVENNVAARNNTEKVLDEE